MIIALESPQVTNNEHHETLKQSDTHSKTYVNPTLQYLMNTLS